MAGGLVSSLRWFLEGGGARRGQGGSPLKSQSGEQRGSPSNLAAPRSPSGHPARSQGPVPRTVSQVPAWAGLRMARTGLLGSRHSAGAAGRVLAPDDLPPSLPQPPVTFILHELTNSRHCMDLESYTICSSVSGLFHLAYCFQGIAVF